MNIKKCPKCEKKNVKKNGKRNKIQRYYCLNCKKSFQNKRRKKHQQKMIFHQYVWQRQTYKDLSERYGKSTKWIQQQLDEVIVNTTIKIKNKKVVLIGDTTFFSRSDGLCVFRNPHEKQNIYWEFVNKETPDVYRKGRIFLEQAGFEVSAIVLDGKRGVRRVFQDIPIQMCHFHQKQIIRRYITSNPRLEASVELKKIVNTLPYTNEYFFTEQLHSWYEKWKDFINEKTINPVTDRWHFSHKRLRSAYKSLKSNLPYLFTYLQYPTLNIPNTTNSLEGYFSAFKNKLYVHRGYSKKRRNKIAIELLKGNN